MSEREILEGYVSHIVFRNEDNGYTVFKCETMNEEETCVGTFSFISEGQYLELIGRYVEHPTYLLQFQVESYEEKQPEDVAGMERYLSSGAIKGIGPNLSKKICKKFKLDTFRVIEEEPERLAEIKGISERMAISIATQFMELQDMRQAMMYLGKYQIPNNYAVKIYNTYGDDLYTIVKENPYKLAEDISGIGFRIADEIARRVGVDQESEFRLKSGIVYTMSQAGGWGHVYLPKEELLQKARYILQLENTMQEPAMTEELLEKCLNDLIMERKIIARQVAEEVRIYAPSLYYSELNTARMLCEIDQAYDGSQEKEDQLAPIQERISQVEQRMEITLDELQKQAVVEAALHGVTIITGGPGTGKTTIINAIIHYFEAEGMELKLAAPTGRAAKRMKEATGCEAQTIHRMLEISGDISQDSHFRFEKDHENPLETDVVIIDEASMVDIGLMHALLEAILPGTRVILVGDVNQLPSVGPGNVLKDIIEANYFTTVRLNHIFRQGEDSRIVANAHMINAGEPIPYDNKSKDFFLMPRKQGKDVIAKTIELVQERMPKYVGVEAQDVQVLVPMRKGETGVENLNQVLQAALNPPAAEKQEHETGKTVYREGDKVMQIKNNYKLEWKIETANGHTIDEGLGVFNGDMGVIRKIQKFSEEVIVEFDEGHVVTYPFGFLDELELAYAVTVHKSQGSEYPVVVIPLMPGPQVLYTRNLIYTAVTRAKKCVVIIGDMAVLNTMIANNNEQKRYSGLKEAIVDMKQLGLGS